MRRAAASAVRGGMDALEPRVLLSSVAGVVWQDRNGDGVRDAAVEPGLAGRTVYIDANENGLIDGGERVTTSAADGAYLFAGLPAGAFTVRQVVPSGWTRTVPAGPDFAYRVTLVPGENRTGLNLGSAVEFVAAGQTIVIPGAAAGDQAGYSVSVDGNVMAVGVPLRDDATRGVDSGAVYLYERADAAAAWQYVGMLAAPDTVAGDRFGTAVDLSGPLLAVGADGTDEPGAANAGAAYVFRRTGPGAYQLMSRVVAASPQTDGIFAENLSLSGNNLVVGEQFRGGNAGAAYVFERQGDDTFAYRATLTNTDFDPDGLVRYGFAVAATADTVFVGALHQDVYAASSGKVYGYMKVGGVWTLTTELIPPSGAPQDYFGASLAASGNTLAIGAAHRANGGVAGAGMIYVFRRNAAGTWAYSQEFGAPDAASQDYMAHDRALAVAGDLVLGGAFLAPDPGKVYAFRDNGAGAISYDWQRQAVTSGADEFGHPIRASGKTIVVGAPGTDVAGATDRGAVYTFERVMAGYVSGTAWQDRNGDGARDAGEPLVAGRTIYLDLNDNGTIDGGEPTVTTDAGGRYEFGELVPGGYVLRQVVPNDWERIAPAGPDFARRVTVAAGQTQNVDFGSALTAVTVPRKLPASDGVPGAMLGDDAAMDGNFAVVGAPLQATGGVVTGAAYVFERQADGSWLQVVRLAAPDGVAGDQFGTRVAIEGTRVVVGAYLADRGGKTDCGAAYVFERAADGSWPQTAELMALDAASGDEFGFDVAVSGGVLAVSADGDDGRAGSAYVFEADPAADWIQVAKLRPADVSGGERFGSSISVDGTRLAIGCEGDQDFGPSSGSAYVFDRTINGSWTMSAKLRDPWPEGFELFGQNLVVRGDKILEGSGFDHTFDGGGSVMEFVRDATGQWVIGEVILAADRQNGDAFGGSMYLDGDLLVVGAPRSDGLAADSGAVYLFRHDGTGFWRQVARVIPSDGQAGDYFNTVAVSDGHVVVGAYYADARGADSGALYTFDVGLAAYVTGVAFDDANRNGVKDAGEAARAGWTVYIDADDDGVQDAGERSFVTDAQGGYHFDDLTPGAYVVRLVQRDEFSQTSPGLGDGRRVTLTSGQTFVGDFGTVNQATIASGVAWNDRNADGVRDVVEPVLAGRTVYWDANDNGILDAGEKTAVSAADGTWSIRNVLPGPRVFRQLLTVGSVAAGPTAMGDPARRVVAVGPAQPNGGVNFGSAIEVESLRQELAASDGAGGDFLGSAIAADGDTVVVGADQDDNANGVNAGAAYVFKRIGGQWTQVAKLTASDGATGDWFGKDVAIDNGTIVVGALYHDALGSDHGAVYVYTRQADGSWPQTAELTAQYVHNDLYFGYSVAISGDTLIAGVPGGVSPDPGSVYVFQRGAGGIWAQVDQWSDLAVNANFGNAVAIDGDRAIVSAPFFTDGPQYDGVIYFYERNAQGAWSKKTRMVTNDYHSNQRLGDTVAIQGDFAVAGAFRNGINQQYGGGFVFRRGTDGVWVQAAEISGLNAGDFAGSVSINGRTVVVGAYLRDAYGADSGGALVAQEGDNRFWGTVREITASEGAASDWLGYRTAITGDTVFVTAPQDDSFGTDHGSVYVYDRVLASYLTGTVWQDANGNGVRDAGEGPLAGRTVYVDANDNGAKDVGEASFVTDGAGDYHFDALVRGNYVVRLVQQDESSQTLPTGGDGWRVDLQPGQTLVGNFGVVNQATAVGGVVWNDRNADGVRDAVETVIPGRTVYWDVNDNGALDAGEPSAVSDAAGAWTIRNVLPGSRVFRQLVPPRWRAVRAAGSDAVRVTALPGQSVAANLGSYTEVLIEDQKFYIPPTLGQESGQWSIDGTIAAISTFDGSQSAVYVFENVGTQWVERARLTSPGGVVGNGFGNALTVQGDRIFIGAYADTNALGSQAGAVYVFRRGGVSAWTMESKIVAADGKAGDNFGYELAVDGSTMVVSAVHGAYVFVSGDGGATWQQSQKPISGAATALDEVAIEGDTILIASSDEGGSGAVHVLMRQPNGQFSETQSIQAPDKYVNQKFYRVSLSGDQMVIADAPVPATNSDGLYYYTRLPGSTTWNFVSKESGLHYGGWMPRWSEGRLLAGASDADGSNTYTGTISLYQDIAGQLTLLDQRAAADSAGGDGLGRNVAFDGDRILVNAPGDDDQGTNAGAVYAFHLGPSSHVTGSVFQDRDDDGIRDGGEPGLAGVTAWLDADDDGVLDPGEYNVTTGADGLYDFTDLRPGAYVVRIVPPALWQQTTPASDQPARVTVASGETATPEFGLYATATVTGRLFTDANGNAVKDGADAALAGWVVFADLNGNRKVDEGEVTAVTDGAGSYTLSYLPVRAVTIDVLDGANRGVTPRAVALQQLLVQTGVDLGSTTSVGQTFPTTGAIAGRAAVDADGNGLVDSFETEGVGALTFAVWRDDGDGAFEPNLGDTPAGSVTSAAGSGAFSLSSLAFGSYWLQLDAASPGMLGYSLYGRPSVKRVVVGAQLTPGVADFSILKAYTVTTLADEIPGSNTPAKLSLREALDLVRIDGKDTGVIVFDPSLYGGTITLDPTEGQLLVRDNVSILGPDEGAPITIAAVGTSRVMSVSSGLVVDLRGFRIVGGQAATGGGVSVGFGATFNGDRLTFDGNAATQRGGAIYASAGSTLRVTDTTLSNNTAVIQGGAIYVGSLTTAVLDRVTAFDNSITSATGDGGGVYSLGDLTARQVTLSGNTSQHLGGGIAIGDGTATLLNDTIASNRGQGGAGGIYVGPSAIVTMFNTLVASNARAANVADDLGGANVDAASGHNLVAAGGGGLVNGQAGNQVGTTAAPLNAGLYALASYGGRVPTIALRGDSPAVEAGDNVPAIAAGLLTDAAGNGRFADFDGDGASTVDIGAFEASRVIYVNGSKDESADTDGLTSLREALALAAARPGFDQIRFAPALLAGGVARLALTEGELLVESQVDLRGLASGRVTIDAAGASRVMRVAAGVEATVANLTLTGGGSVQDGAGAFVAGELTLENVLLDANAATRHGGGAYVAAGGSLTLLNATVSGNAAGESGAGVYVQAGATILGVNDTLTANRADADGNGAGAGGAAFVEPPSTASVTFHNSILAGNVRGSVTTSPDDAAGGFAVASSYNLVGAADGSTGLTGVGARYGSVASPLDPGLFALADNGGPTLTHALRPGSPATDAADDDRAADAGVTADARGLPRSMDGDDDGAARADAGAFEQQFPLNQAPALTTVSTLRGAVEGVPFDISTDLLLQSSDARDPEHAPLGFRVESVSNGSLVNLTTGQPVVPGLTLLLPGQTLRWTPPAINFGSDTTRTLPAFAVRAWDGQVLSVGAPVQVNVEVTTVAEPVNYAVLFSGGDHADLNYPIYYDNLKRTYQTLVNQYGVKPHNIYVIYADGRDVGLDMKGNLNSDLSFAANVLPATRDNLRDTLATLARTVDANDHFFYWTFDHGLGGTNQPSVTGEEIIKGWGPGQAISDAEQRVWLQGLKPGESAAAYGVPAGYAGVRAGFNTYVLAQCFAGGMLDDLATGPDALGPGRSAFGVAAANHYEASYSDYFAAAFMQALAQGYNGTAQAFGYALAHDGRADTRAYAPNGGAWSFNVEHPWAAGGASFPIFAAASNLNAAPELRSIAPLKIATAATTLEITYDMLMAASDTASPSGQAVVFSVAGVDIGTLLRNGVAVNLNDANQRTLAYGQSFTWVKPAGATGTLAALRFKVLDTDGQPAGVAIVAPIRVGNLPLPAGPVAADDAVTVQQNAAGVLMSLTGNDAGVNLRVKDVGVASHGTVTFDPATGQVRYSPAPEFLGVDAFTYLVTDGVSTDLARATVTVVSYNPASGAGADVRYGATVLAPPPGWAGLGESLDWPFRLAAPAWQNTTGVDLSEDGVVVVRTSRPDPNTGAIDYVGSSNAGYRWQSGDTDPYWNYEQQATRTVTASNTFSFLLDAGVVHGGRAVFDGVEATGAANPAVLPTTRYLDPDNANESGFPPIGGIWFDAGTDQQLWQVVPDDLFPIDVATRASGSGSNGPSDGPFAAAFNRVTALAGSRAELWSVSRAGGMQLVAALPGWQGNHRSSASRVNAAGHVVGEAEYSLNNYHAFLYDGATTVDLGALPGHAQSRATAVSPHDTVVGYSSNVRGNPQASVAFIWDAAGGMRSLGTLSAPDGSSGWSVANDVNDAGVVVGASNGHAFVRLGGLMYDLNALANGLPAGAVLTSANAVNEAGQIVATATLPGGTTRAVFLDLVRLFATTPDSVAATSRAPIHFNVLANDTGGSSLTVSAVDTASLKGRLTWDAQGNATYDPAGAFPALAVGQTATTSFTYTAADGHGGSAVTAVQILVTGVPLLNTFHVEAVTVTASGVDVKLSAAPDLSKLNLYDGQDATADPADVRLVAAQAGVVRGSLFWDAATSTLSFVATGPALTPDAYTLTLFSRADGVTAAGTGEALDGDADDVPGGDFAQAFTVAPTAQRTLSVKDFARGPSQGVQLAGSSGIPVSIDDAAGVRSADFEFRYDPAMLSVTGASLAAGMPVDWVVTVNTTTPGVARVGLFGPTALPAGARDLVILAASVPAGAPYRSGQRLRLEAVSVNDGQVAARGDQSVHKVAFLADATGNRTYSALDASLIARVAVGLDGGFDAYPMTDPAIVADASGNGAVGSLDASYVLAKSIGLAQPEIPDLPASSPPPASGPDPLVALPAATSVAPGGTVDVPITIDPAGGLQAFNLRLTFDAARFEVVSVTPGPLLGGAAASWQVSSNPSGGTVTVGGFSTIPLAAGGAGPGGLLVVRLRAKADAAPGTSQLAVDGELNEGGLALTPQNGTLTVTGAVAPATVAGRRLFYNHSALDGGEAGLSSADDAAVATDRAPLLPGHAPAAGNVSGAAAGINGLMVDLVGAANASGLSLADFEFRMSATGGSAASDPAAWPLAPTPAAFAVRHLAGSVDRVSFAWADGAILDRWLRVTVKPTARTGLAADDVFYFGSMSGDATGDGAVDFNDLVLLAQNYNQPAPGAAAVGDFTADGLVDFNDLVQLAQRYNTTLTAPNLASASAAAAAAVWVVAEPTPSPARAAPTIVAPTAPAAPAKPVVRSPFRATSPLPSKPVSAPKPAPHPPGRPTAPSRTSLANSTPAPLPAIRPAAAPAAAKKEKSPEPVFADTPIRPPAAAAAPAAAKKEKSPEPVFADTPIRPPAATAAASKHAAAAAAAARPATRR